VIDPPGLALENFDVTGQWRARDNGVPINAASQLFDGSSIDGPAGLRTALMDRADVMLSSFTEKEESSATERAVAFFLRRLEFLFSFGGIRHFKAKYADRWEPRYVIYKRAMELPRLGIALTKIAGGPTSGTLTPRSAAARSLTIRRPSETSTVAR